MTRFVTFLSLFVASVQCFAQAMPSIVPSWSGLPINAKRWSGVSSRPIEGVLVIRRGTLVQPEPRRQGGVANERNA